MKNTAILAIVEGASFSLDNSLSWFMTQSLQAGKSFTASLAGASPAVEILGVIPILQPIKAVIGGRKSFLVMMRSVVEVPDTISQISAGEYSLRGVNDELVATMFPCSPSPIKRGTISSYLVLSPSFNGIDAANLEALQEYAWTTVKRLWPSEPINSTTSELHLASSGQFMSAKDISRTGRGGGTLLVANGRQSVGSGSAPLSIQYLAWKGAGKTSMVGHDLASGSSCNGSTFSGSTFSGGSTFSSSSGGGGTCVGDTCSNPD